MIANSCTATASSGSSPVTSGVDTPSTHPPTAPPGSLTERLRAAAQAMREGRPVLLTDDRQREDEADLIVAAVAITGTVRASAATMRSASRPSPCR